MATSSKAAQPTTVPTMMGNESGTDSGEAATTAGLGVSGAAVVLVALLGAGGGGVGAEGGEGGVTVRQTGSRGETSHVDTDWLTN